MSAEDWTVDLVEKVATHKSGFILRFEGNQKDPSAIHPGPFPQSLSSLDQVRLLRQGVEVIFRAPTASAPMTVAAPKKPLSVQEKMADYTPKRKVLSLKKNKSDEPV